MLNEYIILREEVLKSMEMVKNYRSLVYTIVIALLAFSFEKENSWLFLMPFIAIIPIYNLAMHQIDSTLRIGAYIYVFLEPNLDIKWETHLYKYDMLYKNQYSTKKSSIDPYIVLSLICILLSIVNLDLKNIHSFDVWGCIVLLIFLSIYCGWLFTKKHIDYGITKEKYIKEWMRIKQEEMSNN